jgi:hypothetical protein
MSSAESDGLAANCRFRAGVIECEISRASRLRSCLGRRIERGLVKRLTHSKANRSISFPAGALGALAVGAFAIGALAIGRLVIGKLAIGRAKMKSLEIDELKVAKLRVGELVVSDSLTFPPGD